MVDSVLLYFDFVYMHEFVCSHVFMEKPQDLYTIHNWLHTLPNTLWW